jgi:hypothetical protein
MKNSNLKAATEKNSIFRGWLIDQVRKDPTMPPDREAHTLTEGQSPGLAKTA